MRRIAIIAAVLFLGCGGGGGGSDSGSVTHADVNLHGTYDVVSLHRTDLGDVAPPVHVLEIGIQEVKADVYLAIDEAGLARMFDNHARPYDLISSPDLFLRWEATPTSTGGFYYSASGNILTTWKQAINVTWTFTWEKISDSTTIN